MLTILIDMDGVVADLLDKWLMVYNNRYKDTITKEQITNWDASLAAKNCSSKDFYSIINEPGFFSDLKVIENSVEVTKRLQQAGHILYFVTATPYDSLDAGFYKSKWVDTYFPHLTRKNVIQTHLKHLVKGDLLLDDSPSNLENFPGLKVVFNMEYNKNARVDFRVGNWNEFEKLINSIQATK